MNIVPSWDIEGCERPYISQRGIIFTDISVITLLLYSYKYFSSFLSHMLKRPRGRSASAPDFGSRGGGGGWRGIAGSNPAGGEIFPEPKRRFIAQSLSCSPFHRLEMTEILLKGRKTLTHPSISYAIFLVSLTVKNQTFFDSAKMIAKSDIIFALVQYQHDIIFALLLFCSESSDKKKLSLISF